MQLGKMLSMGEAAEQAPIEEPAMAQPEAAQPEAAQPEAAQPEPAQPDLSAATANDDHGQVPAAAHAR